MADIVLADRVEAAGLDDRVEVVSAGTGGWHVGEPDGPAGRGHARRTRVRRVAHRAQQYGGGLAREFDLVLAMDEYNLADIGAAPTTRVRLFRDFDPEEPGGEVPDPYYGGDAGFEEVLTMVERTTATMVAQLGLVLE